MSTRSMLLSPRTRRCLADFLCSYHLPDRIQGYFVDAGLAGVTSEGRTSPETIRRRLEEDVDWTNPEQAARVLAHFGASLEDAQDENHRRFFEDAKSFDPDLAKLQRLLERDGWGYDRDSGAIVRLNDAPAVDRILNLSSDFRSRELEQLVERIERDINDDPPAAIGEAKELLEAVARRVVSLQGGMCSNTDGLRKLVKLAVKSLGLETDSRDTDSRDAELHKATKGLISALQQCTAAISDLRNGFGTGHGRGRDNPVDARHAGLAVGAAATVASFLIRTYEARRQLS